MSKWLEELNVEYEHMKYNFSSIQNTQVAKLYENIL